MKPRKMFPAAILFLVLTSIMCGSAQAQAKAQAQIKSKILSLRIDNLKLEAQNLHMLLLQFSEKTSIPVGFEVSPKDDLSLTKRFKIQIEHGMLTEVLEAIVLQDPVYTWRIRDGVVNIFPQECCRDPLLKELLNTEIEKFSIKRGLGKLGFRLNLTDDQAVKALLDRAGLFRTINPSCRATLLRWDATTN